MSADLPPPSIPPAAHVEALRGLPAATPRLWDLVADGPFPPLGGRFGWQWFAGVSGPGGGRTPAEPPTPGR